jgi:predicted MFS family arabinose efflux permease
VTNVISNLVFYAGTAVAYFVLGYSWRTFFLIALLAQMFFGAMSLCGPPLTLSKDTESALDWQSMAASPSIWLLGLVQACQFFTLSGVEYFGPLYFTQHLEVSAGQAAVCYLGAGVGPLVGAAVGSAVADRFGGYRARRKAVLYCLVLATASLFGLPWILYSDNLWKAIGAVAMCLTLHTAISPVLLGLSISTVPGMRNQASAMVSFLTITFGYILGPASCGLASEKGIDFGWQMAWVGPLTLSVAFLLVTLCIERAEVDVQVEKDKRLA